MLQELRKDKSHLAPDRQAGHGEDGKQPLTRIHTIMRSSSLLLISISCFMLLMFAAGLHAGAADPAGTAYLS